MTTFQTVSKKVITNIWRWGSDRYIFKGRGKTGGEGGDTTTHDECMANTDITAFTAGDFSGNSAISAIFARILEQILEQE